MTKGLTVATIPLLMLGIMMPASADAQQPEREIAVWGTSVLEKQPTVLHLEITVMSIAPTAQEATELAEARAADVITDFRQFGLEPKDWHTTRAMVRKPLPDEPKRLAFWSTVTLSVRLDDFSAAGDMLDRAHALKAAGISMQFELDDLQIAYETAVEHAIDDARRRAEVVAREMGVTLGPPLGFEEISEPPQPSAAHPDENPKVIPDPMDWTTINPRSIEVYARVRARYAIVR